MAAADKPAADGLHAGASAAAIAAPQIDHSAPGVAGQMIRNSAFDYARQTLPPNRAKDWAALAIRNGFPPGLSIEAACAAIGVQLGNLAFVTPDARAYGLEIARVVVDGMRAHIDETLDSMRRAAEETGKIDAAVRS